MISPGRYADVFRYLAIWLWWALLVTYPFALSAGEDSFAKLSDQYAQTVHPLLQQFCVDCHAGDEPEGDLDLERFDSLAAVRQAPEVWQKVRRQLTDGEMPPEDSDQPTDQQRRALLDWVGRYLHAEALAGAGDPGAVVLRRLSNAEYTYTIRDLTGVPLDPAREFPIDGAAGEGFTNTGVALVMSPALVTKYMDAAEQIASHAVLLPDGIRFSPSASRRDWADEILDRLRAFYHRETRATGIDLSYRKEVGDFRPADESEGAVKVADYVAALIRHRERLTGDLDAATPVAQEEDLNAKYLRLLAQKLVSRQPQSLLLDRIRDRWRTATVEDEAALTAEIVAWQSAVWKFNSAGIAGREGGPTAWMEPVNPITTRQEFKIELPESAAEENVVVYLTAGEAGDGNQGDFVVWKNPRLVGGNLPELPLRHAAGLHQRLAELRREVLGNAARYLAAVAEATPESDAQELAARHAVDPGLLKAWLEYVDVSKRPPVKVPGHFTEKLLKGADYDSINGWGTRDTPSVAANSSDQELRIPGIASPHSVFVHPSPTLFAAVGWHSPINGQVRIEAHVADAYPVCGNGVEWVLQHRTSRSAENLWQGEFDVRGVATMAAKVVAVHKGELVSLLVGPREGDLPCDLTHIKLVITETTGSGRVWDLAKDVSGNILESNPHSDSHGNTGTWHFYKGEMKDVAGAGEEFRVPAGSLLAQWQAESDPETRKTLAENLQALASGETLTEEDSPDALLLQHLQSLAERGADYAALLKSVKPDARFGKHPLGQRIAPANLVVQAPAVFEILVPAKLAEGRRLLVTGQLDPQHGREGSVRIGVSTTRPDRPRFAPDVPIIVTEGSKTRRRFESAFEDFRQLFPIAVCYARVVPIDEVVTLNLFFREDEHLKRLLLDDHETAVLDRLWDELIFVSHEPLALADAFEQISEFAAQDQPDLVKALKPMGKPIRDRASAFRQRLIDTEPQQVNALLELADRSWRRPLTDDQQQDVRNLYRQMREAEMPHDEAIRLTLARVLTAPAFLYRLERPGAGKGWSPVSDMELATRLSYFLWASMPDEELHQLAVAGRLGEPNTLVAQMQRMLRNQRTRRLAIEFGCQWLHIRDFDQLNEKSERHFPTFADLREEMYEESILFFTDLFQNNRSVLSILDADHTFLNGALARHYGIPGVAGDAWRRVDGMRKHARGGILAHATTLAKQSGASRTSPILRGNWVYETLLGKRLPRPPQDVPQLPDTVPEGLTERQLIEQHSSVEACAKCHAHIDPYGFALESFDAIGRFRAESHGGHTIDTQTTLIDGTRLVGVDGLRDYLLTTRRDQFVRQFCRKLLGYALGRAVQLSDEPLLDRTQKRLAANDYLVWTAVEEVIRSDQFLNVRGTGYNVISTAVGKELKH